MEMTTKNFEDRVNPSDGIERIDLGKNSPVGKTNSDMPATLVQETPMGVDVVSVGAKQEEKAIIHEKPLDEKFPSNVPQVDVIAHEAVTGTNGGSLAALLNHEESEHLRTLWNEIQGKFVDDPRSAVQQADALVADVINKITRMFANEHSLLEAQWKDGKDVSTEDLRKALQHYRSFFNRLVV
jgi:hypothetical protein